jgi:transcriptional regulator with XRE-family HTH domain
MDEMTRKRLEEAGFVQTTVSDLLGLTPAEAAALEIKLALSKALRRVRGSKGLTQECFGKEISVTQSRVARMEKADGSMDLLIGALLKAGITEKEIASIIASHAKSSGAIERTPPRRKSASRRRLRRQEVLEAAKQRVRVER